MLLALTIIDFYNVFCKISLSVIYIDPASSLLSRDQTGTASRETQNVSEEITKETLANILFQYVGKFKEMFHAVTYFWLTDQKIVQSN